MDYLDLKEKYNPTAKNNKRQTSNSLRSSLKLDELLKRSKELDREFKGLDPVEDRKKSDIEHLVTMWNENKRTLGVKDSEAESRVKVLFDMLENIERKRAEYLNDIAMFKKQLDKTYPTTTTELVKKKALEDLIIKRDRNPSLNPSN